MKRAFFVCLFLCLTATFLLSQSNPVPQVNRTPSIASPISASQLPSGRFRAAAHQATPAQASGLNFAPAVAYGSGGTYAVSVAVADLNGDGKPDLVVANNLNGTVGVLLGNGDGTFQTAVSYYLDGSGPDSVTVADVNGDGKPDLLVASFCFVGDCGEGAVYVLLGNGDGTFQAAVAYGSGGYGAYSVAVADLNGDGKPDLAVANFCVNSSGCNNGNPNSGTVGVLIGNGDGTFQTAVTYGSGGASVAVADVNGDGKLDLVVADWGSVGVLLGNGDGTFQTEVLYGSGELDASSVAVADVNGDGKPDLVVSNNSNSTVGVLLGNGDGTFQAAVSYGSGGYIAYSVAVADVNGDGKPDLLVANQCTNSNCDNGGVGVLINTSLTPTTTALVSSLNPSNFGQPVTFTATVTAQQGFYKGTPTGTVAFRDGSTPLGTSPLSGGTATFSTAVLAVGLHSINAVYSGDFQFIGSSASLNQTVNQASTTLMLTSNLNPSGLDSPVTFTATIAPQYGGQASGIVTFKDGATTLGSVAVSGNAASLTTSALTMGTHSITAIYSGDRNFTGSTSNTVSQVVTKATTTITLLSSMNPSVSGKPVTFTAVVSSPAGTPTGKIEYLNGTTVLATVRLTSGSAKYTTSKLPPGANSITAVYEGDSNNSGSTSAAVNQFVLAATTTTLTSSSNPSTYGEAVTFTAVVTSKIGASPNGETVSYMKGTTVLGTGSLRGGSARFTTSTLKVGTNAIKAVYGGDSKFAGSTSNVVKQVVNK